MEILVLLKASSEQQNMVLDSMSKPKGETPWNNDKNIHCAT